MIKFVVSLCWEAGVDVLNFHILYEQTWWTFMKFLSMFGFTVKRIDLEWVDYGGKWV
jgi:cystathionine beta-lyase/cystathionine gamma-synthase